MRSFRVAAQGETDELVQFHPDWRAARVEAHAQCISHPATCPPRAARRYLLAPGPILPGRPLAGRLIELLRCRHDNSLPAFSWQLLRGLGALAGGEHGAGPGEDSEAEAAPLSDTWSGAAGDDRDRHRRPRDRRRATRRRRHAVRGRARLTDRPGRACEARYPSPPSRPRPQPPARRVETDVRSARPGGRSCCCRRRATPPGSRAARRAWSSHPAPSELANIWPGMRCRPSFCLGR